MNRLYVLCILVLLVYGLIVGCWDGTHRESRLEVNFMDTEDNEIVIYERYYCRCGRRPYMEIYR